MGRLAAIAAVCLWVAASAGRVKEGMTRLQGQPLSVVIAKIGLPTDERTVAGKKVYIWGTLGTPAQEPAKEPAKEPREKKCRIQATMNGDVIESFDFEGDESLCERYAARLRP
jgi:hypothetical protein